VAHFLVTNFSNFQNPRGLSFDVTSNDFLRANVEYIKIADEVSPSSVITKANPPIVHVFQLHQDEAGQEELDGEENQNIAACSIWELPNVEFDGLWDTLVYEESIKRNLLEYISTAMLFSDRNINSNIISWNRVVLLHGPPGTGKTSLCKALSQKLAIRLDDRYRGGQLVEINAHSLFSKWFSESGKLVMKLFEKIREMVEDDDTFVCVLIDEVESLTAARQAAIAGTEPSDAIRVVNAVLTQIDQLKKYRNVIILTTSNVTGAIDLAFVDRADIKQYIGPPNLRARYDITSTCIYELMRVGIVAPKVPLLDYKSLELMQIPNEASRPSMMLLEAMKLCEGFSGRAMRKLPFIAHSHFVQRAQCTVEEFIVAFDSAVKKEVNDRKSVNTK
jgi:SpoVK/Ycf46/Vps4 family AAA+-type ATPase